MHAVQDSSIDASTLQSWVVRRRKTDEELAAEFWADIGYPTPASRVWERPSSRRTGEVSRVCRSEQYGEPSLDSAEIKVASTADAIVDVPGLKKPPVILAAATRGVSGVPVRSRPLIKPWIGPIPPPRASPPITLGDLLPQVCLGDGEASPEFCSPALSSGQAGRGATVITVQNLDLSSAAVPGQTCDQTNCAGVLKQC